MAIVRFDDLSESTSDLLPWVDDYYAKLTPSKQKKFIGTFFVVVKGNEAGTKGWICETTEFKLWVWKDALNPLLAASNHAKEHECAIVCEFQLTKTGRLKPLFAVDSEIPAMYSKHERGFFQSVIF